MRQVSKAVGMAHESYPGVIVTQEKNKGDLPKDCQANKGCYEVVANPAHFPTREIDTAINASSRWSSLVGGIALSVENWTLTASPFNADAGTS